GNEKIMYYLSQYFKFPKSFDFLIYISQLIQAESMRYGVEHWRRNRGRCMGATYWQGNDCWPGVSWASIDSFGRWKALHYAAKRFFSPVLLSACEQGAHVSLHVTNETMDNVTAKLSWKLCDSSSNVISQSEKSISIPPLSAEKFEDLDFNVFLRSESDLRNHYLEFSLSDGKILSEGTVLFVPAKHFEFKEPGLKTQVEEQQDRYAITVTSEAFAKFIELDLKSADAVFSDNYFDLSAGSIKNIFVMKENISKALSLEEFEEQLTIRSLADSY
ncbi:MAG: glycoside hydrolase family 2 protein, partial [Clostridia bacterium]|nr:glycoside hydrolase family 2 protein [Clostridia bacterium]